MELLGLRDAAARRTAIERAAVRLRSGALVAFPTETVYGLGANALDADAVQRIFAAKGRPAHNPVIVHVASADAARNVVSAWPEAAARLAQRFWPGPLTLVLPKAASVPDVVTAGLEKVGVRVPQHPVALELLRAAGVPVAAPSANRSNATSPTTAQHVVASLGDADVLVLDGGPCEVGIESTVVDVGLDRVVLLRPGAISRAQLEHALGSRVELAAGVADDAARPAPGMMRRHYAPRARVVRVAHGDDAAMGRAIEAALREGRTGVLACTTRRAPHRATDVGLEVVAMPGDAAAYARDLYAQLHAFDGKGMAVVVVEDVPPGAEWDAVRDRLQRASS